MDDKDQRIAYLDTQLLKSIDQTNQAIALVDRLLGPMKQPKLRPFHPDDAAVDRFADALKAKLAVGRDKGRYGCHDPLLAPIPRLRVMLRTCVSKGDPVDVGAMAMMLFDRGERTAEPLSQELLDTLAEAEKTGALAALLPSGGAVFINRGEEPIIEDETTSTFDAETMADIEQVEAALELCEPEDQAAFARLRAILTMSADIDAAIEHLRSARPDRTNPAPDKAAE